MDDVISRADALAVVRHSKNPVEGIENLPAAGAAEEESAKWVVVEEKPRIIYACSKCGDRWSYGAILHCNYCPNCGKKIK